MKDAPEETISYDDWLISSEKRVKALEDNGMRIYRAEINGVEFSEWCFKHGLERDANGRTKFAMWRLACLMAGEEVEPRF